MASSSPVVIRDNWEIYSYNSEGGAVFVTFYAGADEIPRDDYPYCARVIFTIQRPNANGGPDQEEAEVLWRLEDELTQTLAQHHAGCLLLARLTHAGNRELVFQVVDWESFRLPVGLWMHKNPGYEFEVSEHDGWSFFDDWVWPNEEDWHLIQDRRVIDGLIEAGSNAEKDHALEFVFLGEASKLRKLRYQLAARGYQDHAAEVGPDELIMVKKLPLDLALIYAESVENRQLCRRFEVEFDGWGAAVVK